MTYKEKTIEDAISKLREFYEIANNSKYVEHKIAWSLYQTWKFCAVWEETLKENYDV